MQLLLLFVVPGGLPGRTTNIRTAPYQDPDLVLKLCTGCRESQRDLQLRPLAMVGASCAPALRGSVAAVAPNAESVTLCPNLI